MRKKQLGYTNTQIKQILNDPYGRTPNGKDLEIIKDELAQVLWSRQNKPKACPIERELKQFKKKAKEFAVRLKTDGDTQQLRHDLEATIASFKAFETHVYG